MRPGALVIATTFLIKFYRGSRFIRKYSPSLEVGTVRVGDKMVLRKYIFIDLVHGTSAAEVD